MANLIHNIIFMEIIAKRVVWQWKVPLPWLEGKSAGWHLKKRLEQCLLQIFCLFNARKHVWARYLQRFETSSRGYDFFSFVIKFWYLCRIFSPIKESFLCYLDTTNVCVLFYACLWMSRNFKKFPLRLKCRHIFHILNK